MNKRLNEVKLFDSKFIQPKVLLAIFLVTSLIIFSSALIELHQSKLEMLELMEKQSHTLLETLLSSSDNALSSFEKVEMELRNRLLNNAGMIRLLYEKGLVTNALLEKIADDNKIFRINIFNNNGKKIFSSHKEIHENLPQNESPTAFLRPIFAGAEDTLIIGIKTARFGEGKRFAVALASQNRSAIVLNVDADDLLKFRNQIGFGPLLRSVSNNYSIEYVALQNDSGIVAGAGKLDQLNQTGSDSFIKKTLSDNLFQWRVVNVGSHDVFEAVHAFKYKGEILGVFRLGLSMASIDEINKRVTARVIILSIVLFVLGFITLALVFTKQNFDFLSKRFKAVESFSQNILENVGDAIIVLDEQQKIKSDNKAAAALFNVNEQKIIGSDLKSFVDENVCKNFLNSNKPIVEISCMIGKDAKDLLAVKSSFLDENRNTNTIIVLSDLTEQKAIEKQLERKDRLTAMGELASSVAHEIRNPLNAIGTITQQISKDFEPKENVNEFRELSSIVYKEVKRINETIESFLKFAKPLALNAEEFDSHNLFEQLEKEYSPILNTKNIKLEIQENWHGTVEWDKSQLTQVFINLLNNSIAAINETGLISIIINKTNDGKIEIVFSDNGCGMSPENIGKIFNLYFTTKTKGSGIGLSVVQKIIAEHNGLLSVSSEIGKGTKFTIALPKYLKG